MNRTARLRVFLKQKNFYPMEYVNRTLMAISVPSTNKKIQKWRKKGKKLRVINFLIHSKSDINI